MDLINKLANCGIVCGGLGMIAGSFAANVGAPIATSIWLAARLALPELGYTSVRGIPLTKISKIALFATVGSSGIAVVCGLGGLALVAVSSIIKELTSDTNRNVAEQK